MKGAAGLIIVKDAVEAALTLPRTYGVDDFPVVIQSRAFDANKQLMTSTAADDVILCHVLLRNSHMSWFFTNMLNKPA